jgi:hypothetical protein
LLLAPVPFLGSGIAVLPGFMFLFYLPVLMSLGPLRYPPPLGVILILTCISVALTWGMIMAVGTILANMNHKKSGAGGA